MQGYKYRRDGVHTGWDVDVEPANVNVAVHLPALHDPGRVLLVENGPEHNQGSEQPQEREKLSDSGSQGQPGSHLYSNFRGSSRLSLS